MVEYQFKWYVAFHTVIREDIMACYGEHWSTKNNHVDAELWILWPLRLLSEDISIYIYMYYTQYYTP